MDPVLQSYIFQLGVPGAIGGSTVAGFVWAILTGRLVPIAQVRSFQSERDYWRKAYEQEREVNRVAMKVAETMVENGETTKHFLESLPKPENIKEIT